MTARSVVVGRDGRAKAYRPLPEAERAAAIAAGLAAYRRGDYFEAHEMLEPAWMGTDVPAERALLQGLIKLAAAYVHGVRGNPAGIARNLEGARARLLEAAEDGPPIGEDPDPGGGPLPWLDLPALIVAIEERMAELAARPTAARLAPPDLPVRLP